MNNVGKCQNNVVKMTISKKNKTNHFKKNSKFEVRSFRSFNYYFIIFFTLLPMLVEYVEEYLQGRENSLNIMKDSALLELNLNRFTL